MLWSNKSKDLIICINGKNLIKYSIFYDEGKGIVKFHLEKSLYTETDLLNLKKRCPIPLKESDFEIIKKTIHESI